MVRELPNPATTPLYILRLSDYSPLNIHLLLLIARRSVSNGSVYVVLMFYVVAPLGGQRKYLLTTE